MQLVPTMDNTFIDIAVEIQKLKNTLMSLSGGIAVQRIEREIAKLPKEQHWRLWEKSLTLAIDHQTQPLIDESRWRWNPVPIVEFIEDKYYLNKKDTVYPVLMDELIELNSGRYEEAIFTGGIGAGKSTGALYTQLYQLYLLSCMTNPHESFSLDPSSEIVIIFQSINFTVAKRGDYGRFQHMIESSQYFKEHFPIDKGVTSRLLFPNRIEVHPVSGLETAAIGMNVISALFDEVNYMAVIEKSKKGVDGSGFDQATALYNSITNRRESRFTQSDGSLPGITCIVSSKRYPGQFTDVKEAERLKQINATGSSKIFLYNKRMWEIKPESYSKETFAVFIGDDSRKPRILGEDEYIEPKDRGLVDHIPINFRKNFEKDIINALREIAGQSTIARYPFITHTESIMTCMDRNDSIFSSDFCDFVAHPLFLHPECFYKPELPRYVHIDLGITGDSAGVVIGTVLGFNRISRGADPTVETEDKVDQGVEVLPEYYIDGVLEVKPPQGGEILFWKIRNVIYKLRELGLNIRWVTLDSFQSRDTLQILRQKGFFTGELSMDRTMIPYEVTKTALYDKRVSIPVHKKLAKELASLEKDAQKGKIDHPPAGSKDCISGDTLIPLLNGTKVAIKDLVGTEPWVYSCLPSGEIVPAQARNVHLVGNLPVLRITLDSGDYLDCTEDHEIMLRDGTFIEAKDLKAGVSLMPFRTQLSVGDGKSKLNGYEQIWDNEKEGWIFTHQKVANVVFGHTYGAAKGDRKVVHHVDFRKTNNDPSNLQIMGWHDHRILHSQVGSATGWGGLWKRPEFREAQTKRLAEIGRKTGKANITKYNKSSERIEKLKANGQLSRNGTTSLNKAWANPITRVSMVESRSGDNNWYARRDITIDRIFEVAKNVGTLAELYATLQCTQKVVYRKLKEAGIPPSKVISSLGGVAAPHYKLRTDVTVTDLIGVAKTVRTVSELWKELGISHSVYQRIVTESGMTRAEFKKAFFNHKVVSIKKMGTMDVYDMTVDSTHNFAIGSEIFVHNCADALAGVCFGLINRREVWGYFGIPPIEIPAMVKAKPLQGENSESA